MFSQQQDARQQMPGMQMQPQGQVQQMGAQMPQMQMSNPQLQQQMGGMAQNIPQQNPGIQRPMGAMGPQHPMTGPGVPQQMAMGGGIRAMAGGPQQQTILVKSEPSTQSPQLGSQRMPMPGQPQNQPQDGQNVSSQATQHDKIIKFKQLLPQLKESLVNLISIARQNFAANANIDNLEKSIYTSLFPRFDRALEQFYSICNQIEAYLMLAASQISHTIFSVQYAPLTANQMKENVNNMAVYTSYINTVKQQLAYAKEIQALLAESSNKISARQGKQQQQQQQRGPAQF